MSRHTRTYINTFYSLYGGGDMNYHFKPYFNLILLLGRGKVKRIAVFANFVINLAFYLLLEKYNEYHFIL
jgi:hypothetical protein